MYRRAARFHTNNQNAIRVQEKKSITGKGTFFGRTIKILKYIEKWIFRIVFFGSREIKEIEIINKHQQEIIIELKEGIRGKQREIVLLGQSNLRLHEDYDTTFRKAQHKTQEIDEIRQHNLELQRQRNELRQIISLLEKKIPEEEKCTICGNAAEVIVTLPCCKKSIGQDCLIRCLDKRLNTAELCRNKDEGINGVTCCFQYPNQHIIQFKDLLEETLISNKEIQKKIYIYMIREIRTRSEEAITIPVTAIPHELCCPKCTYKAECMVTPEFIKKSTIDCRSCYLAFCGICKESPHPGITCKQALKRLDVEQRIINLKATINAYECALKDDRIFRPCPICDHFMSRDPEYDEVDCLNMLTNAPEGECQHTVCWICLKFRTDSSYHHGSYYKCKFAESKAIHVSTWSQMTQAQRNQHDRDGFNRCRAPMYSAKIDKLKQLLRQQDASEVA